MSPSSPISVVLKATSDHQGKSIPLSTAMGFYLACIARLIYVRLASRNHAVERFEEYAIKLRLTWFTVKK
jgi:hypothetical protein